MHSNIKITNIQLLDQRKIPLLKSLCIKIKQSYSLMTELKSEKKLNFFFLNF